MTPAQLTAWRESLSFTRTEAASHLGISRRALFNYEQGVRPIPKAISLYCLGVGSDQFPR